MSKSPAEIKKEVPLEFHFLFERQIFDTDSLTDKFRVENLDGCPFNKCENCGHDLTVRQAYNHPSGDAYPINGFVAYYHRYKMVLCDRCVDYKNGQPWRVDHA